MKKMEMDFSISWMIVWKKNKWKGVASGIYLSLYENYSLQQHGKELIMLLYMYNMTIIKSHEVF